MLKTLGALESLESAISSASTGFVITDAELPDNPIVYANPAFHVMTGYPEGEIIGRNCRFLQRGETSRETVDALRDAIKRGEEFQDELLNHRKDGSPFWNRLSVSPIRTDDGRVRGFVGVQEDVTRRVLAESENRRLIAELDEFASIIAHDLQAPLRHIQAFLEIIKADHGEALDEEAAEMFDHVLKGADRASTMVRETLKIARAGRAGISTAPVDLNEVLEGVLTDLSEDIRDAKAELVVDRLPHVMGHPTEFQHVLANLVSNAIKYRATDRACQIWIEHESCGDEERIRIRDTGIGIPQTSADTVFRAFRRGPNVSHRSGSGIGLAVVKRIVESVGGRIGLDSQVDVGSTFEITLPGLTSGA